MKTLFKTAFVLFAICAVSAVVLAFVNRATEPAIKAYEDSVVRAALEEVAAGYSFEERTEVKDNQYVTYYYVLSSEKKVKGYLLGLKSGGYGGELILVASYNTEGVLLSAKLVSDSETPGIGKKAENPAYMDKFIGHGSASSPIPTAKSMLSSVDSVAVTGASMTFNGVSKALYSGSEFVKTLKEGK